MTLEDLKFIQDIFYNLSKKEYYQYTFTSKKESENKTNLFLLIFISWNFLWVLLMILTFRFKLSFWIASFIYAMIGAFIYKKLEDNPKLKDRFYKHLSFRRKLFELIESNGFYKKGEVFGSSTVRYSAKAYYKFLENGFEIVISLDGSKYQDKYTELEQKLYHLFGYRIKEVFMENGKIRYRFTYEDLEPIFVNSAIYGYRYLPMNTESDKIAFANDLVWNYRKQPHALVTGVTGGGKTFILFWMIRNAFANGADLKILDPKCDNLDYLKNILEPSDVASSKGNIIRILRECSQVINDRNIEFQNHYNYSQGKDYKDYGYRPIFIFFDEVTAFFASCDSKESKEANGYLQEIIMKGRSAGVFVVLTTQRADADVISGKIRDQLGLRVAMGGLTPDGNVMTFGNEYRDLKLTIKGVIEDKPRSGVGFIHIDGVTSKPQEFYAPYFDAETYDFFDDIKSLFEYRKIYYDI